MNDSDIIESGKILVDMSYLCQWYFQVHCYVSEIARKILSTLISAQEL